MATSTSTVTADHIIAGGTNVIHFGSNATGTPTAATLVWNNWVGDNCGWGATGATAWIRWNDCAATSTANYTDIFRIWARQVDNSITTAGHFRREIGRGYAQAHAPAIISEETRRRDAEERDRYRRLYEEEQQLRHAAEQRAEKLLLSILSPEQKEDLAKKQCFFLYSKGKKYRVDRGSHGNVKLLNERDQVVESYCVQPRGVPAADAMAAQKLMLETDPDLLRKLANVSAPGGVLIQRATPPEQLLAIG